MAEDPSPEHVDDHAEDHGTGSSARGSAAVSAGVLASRLTGLARERAISVLLGTGVAAEAFAVAFRIPNLLQHLLGEGVLSASFIPNYSRLLGEGDEEGAGRLAGAVLGLLSLATGLVVLVGVLAAEPLTAVIAAGLRDRPDAFALTVRLVRLLFPAVGVLVVSAWCLGVLNSHRRFFLSYVAPAVLNLVQIAALVAAGAVVVGDPGDPTTREATIVTWLAVGTIVGAVGQLVIQLPATRSVLTGLRLSLRRDVPGVRRTIRAFVPVVGARGVVQLSIFAQLFLASFLAAGALAVVRYAQTLYGLPIALFAVAVAAVELPAVGRRGEDGRSIATPRLEAAAARVALLVAPAVVGFVVVGDVLVCALYCGGEFGPDAAQVVWYVLAAYSLGLLASTWSRVAQSTLYGLGDARSPARAAVLRVAVSVSCAAVLMVQLDRLALVGEAVQVVGELPAFGPLPVAERVEGPARLGAVGLGLGAAVAAQVEAVALRRALRRAGVRPTLRGHVRRPLVGATVASALAAVAARPLVTDLPAVFGALLVVAVVALVHLGTARWLGAPAVDDLLAVVTRRRSTRSRD